MPRPNSKQQLLKQIPEEHDELVAYLEALSEEDITEPGTVGDWSAKDVLAHLTAWEQMFLRWYRAGKEGEVPVTPSEEFTWKEIPALNQQIYEQHCDDPLEDVLAQFHASYTEVVNTIEGMTDDEMFTPHVYKWTKTTTLGSYAVSATCSHYAWARKEIRRGINAKQRA